MLDLIKKEFSNYFSSENDIKIFDKGMHTHYYIKTNKDIIMCITIDYKENDFDLFIDNNIINFDKVPLNLHEMVQAVKNKKYKENISKVSLKNLKDKAIQSFCIMKVYIDNVVHDSVNM